MIHINATLPEKTQIQTLVNLRALVSWWQKQNNS